MNNFIHLHLHTEYSLLDGLSNIKSLIQKAKEFNMSSVGLTDHGVMYGAIEFYKACIKDEVKPLIGMEAYVMKGNDTHTDKDPQKKTNANHLILLAKNLQGYRNLMELTSIAHLDGFYYRPRFDKKTLKKYSDGLICTSACGQGDIPQAILHSNWDDVEKKVKWYLDVFGEDYYLEIQRHEYANYLNSTTDPKIKEDLDRMITSEKKIGEGIVKLSREMGIPLVATNDVHYINKDDAEAQDALVCIATGKNVSEVDRLRYIDTPTFYFRSPEEMQSLFPDLPDALQNTVDIAKKCDLQITLGKWFFPKLPDLPSGKTEEIVLKEQARKKLNEKYENATDELTKRLEFELDVICDKGYSGYFLIMADFAEWAREQKIVTNTRGSAAGSLVSYVLNITSVDPIKYLLPFERFLNPYRPSAPDIDFDIADNRRQDLIDYIVKRFGQDKVAQIGTFGRMMARGSVRDIARVLGYDYNTGDRISKLIPIGSQGFPMTIERALEETPELKNEYDNNVDAKKIIDLAKKVEGSARHASVHAAGVVVAPTKITDFTPLQRETKGDKIITQYEMHACDEVGLIKFDVLGITFLTILNTAIDLVRKTSGKEIDLYKIPLDDTKTFDMLGRGDTVGVFQMVSGGMTKWLMDMKPNKVEDLMAMVALYRPGPMANIYEYMARKSGTQTTTYFHPKVQKFLEPSYGILVYQDDLLYTAIELAGYDWEEVDKFRKAVGKKIPEEMARQHTKFVKGCVEHSGMSKDEAESVWKLFEPFQGYGFNKAHSASYGIISYYTAYMKANYPVEYMTAMLTADAGDTTKIAIGVEETKKMDVEVLPPDINQSDVIFSVVSKEGSLNNKAIRFGLSAIKNIGDAAVEAIIEARKDQDFSSLTDFFTRVDTRKVNKKVLESLIKAGAFDRFGGRAALLAGVDELRQQVEQLKKKKASGQVSLFGDATENHDIELIKEKLPDVPEFSQDQKLTFEKELLGFYLSDNPYASRLHGLQLAATHQISELDMNVHLGQIVKVAGIISSSRTVVTKKSSQQMAFATLVDQTGNLDLIIFPKIFAVTKDIWKADQAVLVEGKVDNKEDKLSILVDSVISSTDTPEPGTEKNDQQHKNGNILIVPKGTDRNKLIQLNQILKNSPGADHLTLIFENGHNGGKHVVVPFGIDYAPKLQKEILKILTGN